MIKHLDIEFTPHPRQKQAFGVLAEPVVDELTYGGAKGGGKTVLGCWWVLSQAMGIIEKFKLKPCKYPIAVGFMGRKRAVDFNKTTLETWKKEIPQEVYQINEQKKEIIILKTVKIVFGGFDDRENIEKFNSAEYGFFFVDQAEEISQDEIAMLRAALRLKIKGKSLDYKGLLTANPAQCWLKREFVDKPNEGRLRFLQALPADNPHLPEKYTQTLKEAFKHRPELLEAYLRGSWDAFEGARVIIKSAWLQQAKKRSFFSPHTHRLVITDPARFGDDETVIYYMENTKVVEEKIYGQKKLTDTAGECAEMATRHEKNGIKPLIVVDTDGLGAGVADCLTDWGFEVYEIHSATKSLYPDQFYNLRAEMWWLAGQKYANGDIEEGGHDDPELDRQLTTVNYTFRNGKILIEPKDDIKKRLGRSPDRADTRIMGLHVISSVTPDEDLQKHDIWEEEEVLDPMAM